MVKIPTISSHTWHLLLSFMYTGKVRMTFGDKMELVAASQTLGLTELNGLCSAVYDSKPQPVHQQYGLQGEYGSPDVHQQYGLQGEYR